MPQATLEAFADHGKPGSGLVPDGGDSEAVLADFIKAGIAVEALASRLQDEGAASFVKSWNDLMACIESKSNAVCKGELTQMAVTSSDRKRVPESAEVQARKVPMLRVVRVNSHTSRKIDRVVLRVAATQVEHIVMQERVDHLDRPQDTAVGGDEMQQMAGRTPLHQRAPFRSATPRD